MEDTDLDSLLLVENSFLVDKQEFANNSDANGSLDELFFEIDRTLQDEQEQSMGSRTSSFNPSTVEKDAKDSLETNGAVYAPPKRHNPTDNRFDVIPTKQIRNAHNHAKGFERLINYVKEKYSRESANSIFQSLSCFRPGLISTGMTMGEHDLLLVERCFQRLLQDLYKLVAHSGLAIAVWRRTGELALVNRGFLLLTQYSIKSLIGYTGACKGKPNISVVDAPDADGVISTQLEINYEADKAPPRNHYNGSMNICELFNEATAVNYFKKFAQLVLDESRSSIIIPGACVITNKSTEVAVTLNLSLKRDIFDIPMCVVGTFLVNLDGC